MNTTEPHIHTETKSATNHIESTIKILNQIKKMVENKRFYADIASQVKSNLISHTSVFAPLMIVSY